MRLADTKAAWAVGADDATGGAIAAHRDRIRRQLFAPRATRPQCKIFDENAAMAAPMPLMTLTMRNVTFFFDLGRPAADLADTPSGLPFAHKNLCNSYHPSDGLFLLCLQHKARRHE
ncbi:MAG: hypothetical protein LBV61_09865 [Burkholderiaceae bacterium]|nr:hypothetical protein [Burkholderiaceae bacterium]